MNAKDRQNGSAMVETAIVLPLYMILIFALIFFGYSTLAKQREVVADNYVIMQKGRQSAFDVLPLFFPWNPPPRSLPTPLPDESQASAGDVRLRVHDVSGEPDVYAPAWQTASHASGVGDTFDAARVAEYLWVASQPIQSQQFEWRDGRIIEIIAPRENFRSRYLKQFVDRNSPPTQTRYTLGTTYGINCAQQPSWLDHRRSELEYFYSPPFFPHVYGGEPLTTAQYMTMSYPKPTFTPTYRSDSRMMARGEGQRYGTLNLGAQRMVRDMSVLLNDGRDMPDPISDSDLDAIRASHWPGVNEPLLWVAR